MVAGQRGRRLRFVEREREMCWCRFVCVMCSYHKDDLLVYSFFFFFFFFHSFLSFLKTIIIIIPIIMIIIIIIRKVLLNLG